MRKLMAVVVVLGLMLIGLKYVEAISPLSMTYTSTNNTGVDVVTEVSTSTIVPGRHKILGFTVVPIAGSTAGALAGLYSGATGMTNTSTLLGEAESLKNESKNKIFPYPKAVRSGGLIISQSCYSIVIIDYTR